VSSASRAAKGIAWGAISGILYYLVFAFLIPKLLSLYGIPLQGEASWSSPYLLLSLIVIIALDVIGYALRFPLSLPFYLSSAAVALFVMGSLVGWGKISREVSVSGQTMLITVDASPLIAAIIGISIIYAALSSLERMSEEE